MLWSTTAESFFRIVFRNIFLNMKIVIDCQTVSLLVKLLWLSWWLVRLRLRLSMTEVWWETEVWGLLSRCYPGPASSSQWWVSTLVKDNLIKTSRAADGLKEKILQQILLYKLSLFNNMPITITYFAVIALNLCFSPPTEFINSNKDTDLYSVFFFMFFYIFNRESNSGNIASSHSQCQLINEVTSLWQCHSVTTSTDHNLFVLLKLSLVCVYTANDILMISNNIYLWGDRKGKSYVNQGLYQPNIPNTVDWPSRRTTQKLAM